MSTEQRLHELESAVSTLTYSLDIAATRLHWAMRELTQRAEQERLDELERLELLVLFDCVDSDNPFVADAARRALQAYGCSAPDLVPVLND